MILTDREIAIALDKRQLIIDPRPDETAFSSTTIDLTLAENGLEWIAVGGVQIRPGHPDYDYAKTAEQFQKAIKMAACELKRGSFVLGWTKEVLQFPVEYRLAARVEGKSSLARLGIGVHVTAPTIHSGFGIPVPRPVQLEIFNFGPHSLFLDPGMKICQLIIEQTFGTPDKGYEGQFRGQVAQP